MALGGLHISTKLTISFHLVNQDNHKTKDSVAQVTRVIGYIVRHQILKKYLETLFEKFSLIG